LQHDVSVPEKERSMNERKWYHVIDCTVIGSYDSEQEAFDAYESYPDEIDITNHLFQFKVKKSAVSVMSEEEFLTL
jgi:hypothetical protein